ncbi:hypothetical protein Tco_1260064 [Tanacetum coccineum]
MWKAKVRVANKATVRIRNYRCGRHVTGKSWGYMIYFSIRAGCADNQPNCFEEGISISKDNTGSVCAYNTVVDDPLPDSRREHETDMEAFNESLPAVSLRSAASHSFPKSLLTFTGHVRSFENELPGRTFPYYGLGSVSSDLLVTPLLYSHAYAWLRTSVDLSPLCLSLENALAVCEERVPLDAVTGLVFSLLRTLSCSRMILTLRIGSASFDLVLGGDLFTNGNMIEDFLLRKVAPLAYRGRGIPRLSSGVRASVTVERMGHDARFTLLPSG